jgi:integrase
MTAVTEAIERYLRTGEYEHDHPEWEAATWWERAKKGHDDLLHALVAEVKKRSDGRQHHAVPDLDVTSWTRRKLTDGALHKKHPDHVKEKRTAYRDSQLLRLYVLPITKDIRLPDFELEHAEAVMASLPGGLAAATRRHVAQVISRVMRLAVYPGKWIANSPIPRGWLPRVGDPKAKECLFPDEDACLLAGRSIEPDKDGIPIVRRFAYGFLMREGMRTDEMAGLRWREVDLERGRVNLDENKTDDPRDWDLRPDTAEALRRWKERSEPHTQARDHVFAEEGVPVNVEHLAEQLRRDLWRVGVRRPQLHESTKGRQRLRAHDLRATFVTIALATGKTETWISDRTGHRSHAMIETYRRRSRTWNLGELGPMCELIPELQKGADWAANGQQTHRTGGEIGRRSGFRFRRRKAYGFDSLPVHFRILTIESRIELFDVPPRSAAANATANSGMAVSASTGLSPSSRQRRTSRS